MYNSTGSNTSTGINNVYNVISPITVKNIKIICFLGIMPILVVSGIILNSFCLVLFCKVKQTSSTVVMLFGLTASDILFLLNGAVNSLIQSSTLYGWPFKQYQRMMVVLYFSTYINTVPGKIANCLTFFIALERLFCVTMPLKIRQYSTKGSAIVIVLISYILTMLLCLPNLFLYEADTIVSNRTGTVKTFTILKTTDYGKNEQLSNIMYILQEVTLYYLPVIGVSFASLATAVIVIIQGKRRVVLSTSSTTTKQEKQVTRMLLTVTSLFVLCKLPGTILRMVVFIDPVMTPMRYKNNTYEVGMAITYVITMCNSVFNFIIYFKTSTTYRQIIQKMFHRKSTGPYSCSFTRSSVYTISTSA